MKTALTNSPGTLLQHLAMHAIAAGDPEQAVAAHLPSPPAGRTLALAVGKAAPAMARALARAWPTALEGVVVMPHDLDEETPAGWRVFRSAHPVPDAGSLAAGRAAMQAARTLGADDLLLVLLSGGTSSLLCLPPAGMSFAEKQDLHRFLLASGLGIRDMNTIRRHLSAIKGGRLALAAWPAPTHSLAISDVPRAADGTLAAAAIGSGPTVGDSTTLADARALMASLGCTGAPSTIGAAAADPWRGRGGGENAGPSGDAAGGQGGVDDAGPSGDAAGGQGGVDDAGPSGDAAGGQAAGVAELPAGASGPAHFLRWLNDPALETPTPDHPHLARAIFRCVLEDLHAVEALEAEARAQGALSAERMRLEGSVAEVAVRLAARIPALREAAREGQRPALLVAYGETALALPPDVPADARGGRNSALALELALALQGAPDVWALCLDTDGIDGTGPHAGAFATPTTLARLGAAGWMASDAQATFRSATALAAIDGLLVTGRTGTNLSDLCLLMVWPAGGGALG